jgi:hypothetical protein
MAKGKPRYFSRDGREVAESEAVDERGVVRDGFRLRVPVEMRDASPSSPTAIMMYSGMGTHSTFYDDIEDRRRSRTVVRDPKGRLLQTRETEEEEDSAMDFTDAEAVRRAFIDSEARWAGGDGADERQKAYAQMCREMQDAWRNPQPGHPPQQQPATPPSPRPVLDAQEARRLKDEAWDEMVKTQQDAWKKPPSGNPFA